MSTLKIIWVSRHTMTAEQYFALKNLVLDTSPGYSEIEVESMNLTLPETSPEACVLLASLAHERGAEVAAVLPAHIAARWTAGRWSGRGVAKPRLYLPVSVPASAKEGEVRGGGFTFSHWEMY